MFPYDLIFCVYLVEYKFNIQYYSNIVNIQYWSRLNIEYILEVEFEGRQILIF